MNNQQQINEHNAITDMAKFNVNFKECGCNTRCFCVFEPKLLYIFYKIIQKKTGLYLSQCVNEIDGINVETFTYYTKLNNNKEIDETILTIYQYFENETIYKINNIHIELNNNTRYNNEYIKKFVNILINLIDTLCE